MRRPLALAVLLALAACDSAGPTDRDVLVGTWTLTGLREELRVTSQAGQVLPDLTAEAEGAVEVTGDVSAQLSFLAGATASEEGRAATLYETQPGPAYEGEGPELFLFQYEFSGFAAFYVAGEPAFTADLEEGVAPFVVDGAVVTVPPLALTSEDGGEAVAGGTLRFPEIALPAGQPTRLPDRDLFELFAGDVITFTFEDDGTFEVRTGGEDATTGTWEVTGDGEVTIRIREDGATDAVTFEFQIERGTLALTLSGPDGGGCDAECRRGYEALLLAAPGSLSDVASTFTYEFTAGAEARRRPASEARVRPEAPGRPSPPLVGRPR